VHLQIVVSVGKIAQKFVKIDERNFKNYPPPPPTLIPLQNNTIFRKIAK
jgi:hypothetical protein